MARSLGGWLGVAIQPVSPDIAKAFGLTGEPRGALVADVTPHSPAERSGINKGDIILELNGAPVSDSSGTASQDLDDGAGHDREAEALARPSGARNRGDVGRITHQTGERS